ncbi:uncharacterized protein LOC130508577 [Raphanus sativus]|uniref:Uncharacterized protein LOC130508577 n=1 Tax=Raphanus sativus TaxID=3726 RepID=A0A9W3D9Q0_RAPSA|nr:uncharacterized protein LOC130508577 [Raphanus sativus]
MASMKKTISEMQEAKSAGQCVVVVTIEAVDVEKSWYYTACNICNRRVVRKVNDFDAIENHVQLNPRYNCIACKKDVEQVIHCYYLVLRVTDKSKAKAKFLLFNNAAHKLIRRSAFELVEEAAEGNPWILPQSLTDVIGRKVLFWITIKSYGLKEQNSTYVVDQLVDDA